MTTKYSTIVSIITALAIMSATPVAFAQTSNSLEISTGPNSPESAFIEVDLDNESAYYQILEFALTNNSNSDITDMDLEVVLTTPGENPLNVINEAYLIHDSRELDSESVTSTGPGSVVYGFGNGVEVNVGETTVLELIVNFEAQDGNYRNDQLLYASVFPRNIMPEDAIEVTGQAESDDFRLLSSGLMLNGFETTITSLVQDGDNNDVIRAEIEIELYAFESDVYLDRKLINRVFGLEFVDEYYGEKAFGNATFVVTQGGVIDGDYYVIPEGSTETFVLSGELTPEFNGYYRLENALVKYRLEPNGDRFALHTPVVTTSSISISDRRSDQGNARPDAVEDVFNVFTGDDIVRDLAANDIDEDGDEIEVTFVTSSNNDIKVVLRRDNQVRISVLPRTLPGSYTLNYAITDGQETDAATVIVVVR